MIGRRRLNDFGKARKARWKSELQGIKDRYSIFRRPKYPLAVEAVRHDMSGCHIDDEGSFSGLGLTADRQELAVIERFLPVSGS